MNYKLNIKDGKVGALKILGKNTFVKTELEEDDAKALLREEPARHAKEVLPVGHVYIEKYPICSGLWLLEGTIEEEEKSQNLQKKGRK